MRELPQMKAARVFVVCLAPILPTTQARNANAAIEGSTNAHVEYVPKSSVRASTSQKCSGGLWVKGVPPRVGRNQEADLRISRMTCPYLVSSPTNRSRPKGDRKSAAKSAPRASRGSREKAAN
jgi:hypothetical protein